MKIICVGRNYVEHARELGNEVPEAPVLFMKAKNALLQPGRAFYYPDFSNDIHYEAELVIKICKNGRNIAQKFASKYYEEVSVGIDFTARDLQQVQKKKGLPWEISKAFDDSAAVGRFQPIPSQRSVQDFNFTLEINGRKVQQGHTGNMIYSVDFLISYISQFFSLNKGDLIFTGTPAGVGSVFVGDQLELFLEGVQVLSFDVR